MRREPSTAACSARRRTRPDNYATIQATTQLVGEPAEGDLE
jgi:hypothetical protein